MKVYLVYVVDHNTYSYSGLESYVDSVFLDETKAKEYINEINKNIRAKDEHAFIVPETTSD